MTTDSQDDLRARLLEIAALRSTSTIPAETFLTDFLRVNRSIRGGARGFLGAVTFALDRQRMRTLLLLGWDGVAMPPAPIGPAEEAIGALYRWLREDLHEEPREALAKVQRALEIARPRIPTRIAWPETPPPPVIDAIEAGDRALTDDRARAARLSAHPHLLDRWTAQWGADLAEDFARAAQNPAPLDLRADDREAVLAVLAAAGVEAMATPHAPQGIRLQRKVALAKVAGLDPASLEIQDEGSQLVSLALGLEPGMTVLDACAGAGGKTLHLAALLAGTGMVVAHDTDAERMTRMRERRGWREDSNIRIATPGTAGEHGPFDAVLIDAPCTGMGRLRREPDVAWRGGSIEDRLAALAPVQRECLDVYTAMLRPGGVLVYATCSPEPEETSAMIDDFLDRHPGFTTDPLPELFQRDAFAPLRDHRRHALWLLPSMHGTDGFFIARLRRSE